MLEFGAFGFNWEILHFRKHKNTSVICVPMQVGKATLSSSISISVIYVLLLCVVNEKVQMKLKLK